MTSKLSVRLQPVRDETRRDPLEPKKRHPDVTRVKMVEAGTASCHNRQEAEPGEMAMQDRLATRRWAARLLTMMALILAAAAAYAMVLVTPQTRIPLDWLHWVSADMPADTGIWALFILPGILLGLAAVTRWSRGWLPKRASRRKAMWVGLFILNLLTATLQYVLMSQAIAAAAVLPG